MNLATILISKNKNHTQIGIVVLKITFLYLQYDIWLFAASYEDKCMFLIQAIL